MAVVAARDPWLKKRRRERRRKKRGEQELGGTVEVCFWL